MPLTLPDADAQARVCAAKWHLTLGSRLQGGYLAAVYECWDRDGTDLVLKLSPPVARPELEARALSHWAGRGAVELRAFDSELSALLMVRVRPGTLLSGLPESAAVAAAGETLRLLHSADQPNPDGFLDFNEWLNWYFDRLMIDAEQGTAGVAMLPLLRRAAERLGASTSARVLCHGDFISKNLLLSSSGSYLAADPLPFVGDPCADVGFFSAYFPPARSIAGRAAALAGAAGLDTQRCMRWAAVWAIGEACETWRDDSDGLQAWVRGSECARLLSD